ncbi:hypothetical protein [Komagataeibacter kakiaceti]|uniref:hypothetical protein n=1 Tax=Komagataeibacter kakiaceti TaxID=943261 RepID=UPI00389935E2
MFSSEQKSAIETARAGWAQTRRLVVPAVEDVLYSPIPVLETGFVRAVDYMGGDSGIVQARAFPTARARAARPMTGG